MHRCYYGCAARMLPRAFLLSASPRQSPPPPQNKQTDGVRVSPKILNPHPRNPKPEARNLDPTTPVTPDNPKHNPTHKPTHKPTQTLCQKASHVSHPEQAERQPHTQPQSQAHAQAHTDPLSKSEDTVNLRRYQILARLVTCLSRSETPGATSFSNNQSVKRNFQVHNFRQQSTHEALHTDSTTWTRISAF